MSTSLIPALLQQCLFEYEISAVWLEVCLAATAWALAICSFVFRARFGWSCPFRQIQADQWINVSVALFMAACSPVLLSALGRKGYIHARGRLSVLHRVVVVAGLGFNHCNWVWRHRLSLTHWACVVVRISPLWYWVGGAVCCFAAAIVDLADPQDACHGSPACLVPAMIAFQLDRTACRAFAAGSWQLHILPAPSSPAWYSALPAEPVA